VSRVRDHIAVNANLCDNVQIADIAGGFALRVTYDPSWTRTGIRLPEGHSVKDREVLFSDEGEPLNEFGYLYVALYICGMLVRYYPDIWMRELSENSKLAQLVEHFCWAAEERLPLLTLGELDRTLYLQK
jgi:hypothetical protein